MNKTEYLVKEGDGRDIITERDIMNKCLAVKYLGVTNTLQYLMLFDKICSRDSNFHKRVAVMNHSVYVDCHSRSLSKCKALSFAVTVFCIDQCIKYVHIHLRDSAT